MSYTVVTQEHPGALANVFETYETKAEAISVADSLRSQPEFQGVGGGIVHVYADVKITVEPAVPCEGTEKGVFKCL